MNFQRLIRATGYSVDGLRAAYRSEAAFRQEVGAAALLLPAAVWVGRNWVETALLAGSVLGVMIVELINSAIEATIDRISLERHALSKRAKDQGSAAVLLAVLVSASLWLSVIWERWLS